MNDKSDSIKNLASALAEAQASMPAVPMNSVNPFLHSKFADLGSIVKTAQPILAQHGLSVSQRAFSLDGTIGIKTILMHTSGEWIESSIALPLGEEKGKSIAQAAGSIITYLRRYSLSAILNMYAEEDADGNKPQKSVTGERTNDWPDRPWDAETLRRAMAVKVKAYKGKQKEPSEGQLDYVRSSLGKLKLSDPDRHTVTLYLFGTESTGDLNAAQCSAIIDWIGAKEPDYEISEDAIEEVRAVIKQYEIDRGQMEMELPPD